MHKLFLRTFLVTGTIYGILMSITDFFDGKGFNFLIFLFLSIFFGLFMAIGEYLWVKESLENIGIVDVTDKELRSNQKRDILSQVSPKEFIEKLKHDSFGAKVKVKNTENYIELRKGVSMSSWGEVIKLYPIKTESGWNYQVTSKQKFIFSMIDYGVNLRNVYEIQRLLTSNTNNNSSFEFNQVQSEG